MRYELKFSPYTVIDESEYFSLDYDSQQGYRPIYEQTADDKSIPIQDIVTTSILDSFLSPEAPQVDNPPDLEFGGGSFGGGGASGDWNDSSSSDNSSSDSSSSDGGGGD